MSLTLGPVLYFRGVRGRAWRLSALVGAATGEEPPALATEDGCAPPCRLAERCGRGLWRYDFALPLAGRERELGYRIGDRTWRVRLPAVPGPLHIAYTACNGSEKGDAWANGEARNERWLHLAARHAAHPFHLLLQGGDQLYADPIWRDVPALARWRRRFWWRRLGALFTAQMAEAVADDYFARYWSLWGQAELAPLLATIPSLMMWDDHDIFDGWGSWSERWQRCPTFRGICTAAREHFALFQLAARPDDLPEGFSDRGGGHFAWAYRIGEIGILAPDLRSERSRERVLEDAGRRALGAALAALADCRQVLLVSSMPLVNPHLSALEHFFELLPGHQTWQDDLVDQWPSTAHWAEWTDLLRQLVAFSAGTGARITSVSGEIHLGALGLIESGATRIYQLTSSGIVHPPPSPAIVAMLEKVALRTSRPAPELTVRLLPLPGLGRRFLRARNWLELELPGGGALTATWHSADPAAVPRLSIGGGLTDGGAPETDRSSTAGFRVT